MSKIVLNLYSYNKKKGYLPKDSNNNILYKNKKNYITDLRFTYYYLGLEPIYETKLKKIQYTEPDYKQYNEYAEYWAKLGIGNDKVKYLKYDKFDKCLVKNEKFVYLYIRDESKLSWNTVLRYLKVKKNTGAFFVEGGKVAKHLIHNNIKVLALPCKNIIKNKDKIANYFHNNLAFIDVINPFKFNVNCFTIDGKLLYLNDIIELVKNVKPVDLDKLTPLKERKIVYRKGEFFEKEQFMVHNREDIPISKYEEFTKNHGFDKIQFIEKGSWAVYEYKESWYIHNLEEYHKKIYQITPNLIRTLKDKYNKFELKEVIFSIILNMCKDNFDLCENDIDIDFLYKIYSKAYEFCLHNQKDLSLKNDRHISNIKYLSALQLLYIDMYIMPKSLATFCPYKLDKNIKQWQKIAPMIAKEILGKTAYDKIKNNKTYNSRWSKFSNKLDKHINNSFISDKEFNLIIDEIKANNPDITITPNANIKYEFMKSLGLTIDEETYDFELCGKTIVNALEMLNSILLKNLSLIKSLIKDRFYIIIYVKKINEYLTDLCNTLEKNIKLSHKTDPPDISFN